MRIHVEPTAPEHTWLTATKKADTLTLPATVQNMFSYLYQGTVTNTLKNLQLKKNNLKNIQTWKFLVRFMFHLVKEGGVNHLDCNWLIVAVAT